MFFTLPIIIPVAAFAAVTKTHLMGRSHARYDRNDPVTFKTDPESTGIKAVESYLHENFIMPAADSTSGEQKLSAKRERFEQIGLSREFPVTFSSAVAEADGIQVDGEWTMPPGGNPDQRLLYLHGGAFTVGSAISHRPIISNIAMRTGCAVFAPNYRLMPENSRMAAIEDAQAAYKWILENGPSGPAPAEKLAVAGDSAGGNLTLMLSNWVRDNGLRQADAVVGLSPATDSTFESPSIKGNIETDSMLRPLAGPLVKLPRTVLVWGSWKQLGMSPASPLVSPLRADLSGLPPTLIQVSASEILYDDARRYVVKAQSQGTDAKLQSWDNLCHVWQAFDTLLPEANQAFDEIAAFLIANGVGAATPAKLTKAKPKAAKKIAKTTKSAKPAAPKKKAATKKPAAS